MNPNRNSVLAQELSVESIEFDLQINPRYSEYFNTFEIESVQSFIKYYASVKYFTLQNKEFYREAYESFHSECMSWAEFVIKMVLQKKLFNLQCLWRAEKIDLSPFVEVSRDFEYWSKNIMVCPFVEPVTPNDIDIATSFLKNEWFCIPNWYDKWQDYSSFKAQRVNDQNLLRNETANISSKMPCFYYFYDSKTDSEHILDLPDIRGEKERKYEDAYFEKYRQDFAEQLSNINNITTADKPLLTVTATADFLKFIADIEDRDTKEAFFYKNAIPANEENFELEKNLELLKKIKEPVEIPASSDWQEGIAQAVRAFKQRKALEFLPYVYDLYSFQYELEDIHTSMFRRKQNFAYDESKFDYHFLIHWRNRILEGRGILGEPENFKF